MKNKTIVIAFLAIALVSSMFMVAAANATCNLPPDPVTVVFVTGPLYPIELRLPGTATLSGVPAGYDVTNGDYVAYCVELGVYIGSDPYSAMLVCTDAAGSPWNEINWLLNNYPDSLDLQMAIWRLLGDSEAFIISQGWPFTTAAGDMYTAALAHSSFDPGAGQWVAVRCVIDGAQDVMIRIQIPEESSGFTPGFWKHNIGVYLTSIGYDDVNVNGAPSAFEGGSLDGVKCDAAVLGVFDPAFLYDQWIIMSTGGGGAIAQARADAANWFNAYFGYGPFED